jgi:hypothetical protein
MKSGTPSRTAIGRFRARSQCSGIFWPLNQTPYEGWLRAHVRSERLLTDISPAIGSPTPTHKLWTRMPSESRIAQWALSAADPFTHDALEEDLAEGIRDFPRVGFA